MDLTFFRETNRVVAAILAVEAGGDQNLERELIDSYSRILDGLYDKGREYAQKRRAA